MDINKLDINKLVSSKAFKWSLLAVAEFILLAIVFSAGMRIGIRKASFSYAFGANYERNFAGPAHGPMGPNLPGGPAGFFRGPEGDMRNAHGLAGTIVSITDNKIVVKDRENNENTIAVDDKTLIKSRGGDLKITDLKNDQMIVVLGRPDNNGVINAELIRVFDNNSNNNQNPNSNPSQN